MNYRNYKDKKNSMKKQTQLKIFKNVKKGFNPEVKNKIINNLEVINSLTSNKKTIQPILESEFIRDLNKACDLARNK